MVHALSLNLQNKFHYSDQEG